MKQLEILEIKEHYYQNKNSMGPNIKIGTPEE